MFEFTLRDVMPYLIDLGEDLTNSHTLTLEDIRSVFGTASGREEIINAVINSATAKWEKEIEEAKKGKPLTAEDLLSAELSVAHGIFGICSTALDAAQKRSQIHLRPECYSELLPQHLAVFRLRFLCGLSEEDIAERLQLVYDYAPMPEYGINEWRRVTGREASSATFTLLSEMIRIVRQKIDSVYQQERESLLEQQERDAIAFGCPLRIDEIKEGIVPGVRQTLQEMDITHLAELRKVTEDDIKSSRSPSISKSAMAKLTAVMQRHGVTFKADPYGFHE